LARQGRRPLSVFVLVALMLLLAAAAVAVIFSERFVGGSVPGDSPVLSLAAAHEGFLAGTSGGLFVSRDGKGWERHPRLGRGAISISPSPFAPEPPSNLVPPVAIAASDRKIFLIPELNSARELIAAPEPVSGLGVFELGVLVGARRGNIYLFSGGGFPRLGPGGPTQVQALAGAGEDPAYVLTAGIDSGIWRATGPLATEQIEWRQLLETPATAVIIDGQDSNRILIGTAGGILVSTNRGESWRFSEFRGSVSGLSELSGEFFAVSDRLIYRSPDGDKDWAPLAARN
jgi:photosystem II stability/assembly factor-like uncharacterized protein